MLPTVVRADPDSRVSQEEVFGPFVSYTTFRTDDEAIALANGTDYGLGGGLWTGDLSRAHRIARAFRSGMVWVNSYKRVEPGFAVRRRGPVGLRARDGLRGDARVHRAQSVWINVDAQLPPWYPRPRAGS